MLIPLHCSDNCSNELNKTIVYSEIPLSKNLQHAETSQVVFRANQLTGFHTTQSPVKGITEPIATVDTN